MTESVGRISVLGAGSWGTALAMHLARNQVTTYLWGRDAQQLTEMATQRQNQRYLPEIEFPPGLLPEVSLQQCVQQADDLLIAVPSHGFRELLVAIKPYLRPEMGIIWATKGLDSCSGDFLHQVVQQELGGDHPVAILSGPTFAGELAKAYPTAITLACQDSEFAQKIVHYFHNDVFRVYLTDDLIGVQVGGAVKNVLAIATGISDGIGFGANTRTAVITRGLAEMIRLGVALGARRETFMGLAGVGDLMLTSTDDQSRNRRFGLALGQGATVEQAKASISQVVEGARNVNEVLKRAQEHQVDMPISAQIQRVLVEGIAPLEALKTLMSRAPKLEYL